MNYYEYLEEHGISETSATKFDLHADSNRLVIPIKDSEGEILYNKYRNLDFNKADPNSSKYTFDKDSHPTLYNLGSVQDSSYVVICEGEIDAIRLDQEGIVAVSGTGGAQMFKPEWAELLKGKNIFLCFDSDEAGRKSSIKIATQYLPTARLISLPDETKDISEYFKSGKTKADFFGLVKQSKMAPLIPVLTGKQLLETEYPAENWIIDKFLPEQSIVLLVGEAGTFKSYLSLYLTKQLITQEPFLGHWDVKRKCRILVIDKENKLRRIKQRMEALQFPKTDDLFFLQYPEEFMLDNETFLIQISSFISQQHIDVVILDSFIDMFTGNENSSTDTSSAINAIRKLSSEATFIAIHHDSKPIPKMVRTAAQKTRGSSNIIAQVDTQFYLEKGKDLKSIIIEQGKSRDDTPIPKFSVEIAIDNEQISDFIYKGELKSEVTQTEEVVEFIYQMVLTKPLISKDELTDLAENQFSSRLVQTGLTIARKRKLIDSIRQSGQGNKMFYLPIEVEGGGELNDNENE